MYIDLTLFIFSKSLYTVFPPYKKTSESEVRIPSTPYNQKETTH